jgi:glycosyltransferase involved in cell wall biosynthesis
VALPPLSIATVCRNNVKTMGAVLEAVKPLVEATRGEIVAVDSGSTDGTIELLEAAGARVVRSEWLGHVKTKQKALDEAAGPWVLCLDSDEPPTPGLIASILKELEAPRAGAYRMIRKVWYRGEPLRYAWQPEWRLRLVKKGSAAWAGEDPHDRLEAEAGVVVMDLAGDLRHDSFETFADHLAKQVALSRIAARSAYAAGRRSSVWRMATSPVGAFLKQVVLKQAWRDGVAGWLAAGTTAAGALMKHMMLLELGAAERDRGG